MRFVHRAGIILGVLLCCHSVPAAEGPTSFTFQGRFLNSNGDAPIQGKVDLTVSILPPSGSECVLYEETQTDIDLSGSQGAFALQIGTSVSGPDHIRRTSLDPGFSVSQIFSNNQDLTNSATNCTYHPAAGDPRRLRVTVRMDGTSTTLTPDYTIASVPFARWADTLQGKSASDFLGINDPNFTKLTGGGESSDLHNHNNLYVKIGAANSNVGSIEFADDSSFLKLSKYSTSPSTSGWGAAQTGRTWIESGAMKYWNGSSVQTVGTASSGGISSIVAGTGLAGGTITTNGTISLATITASRAMVSDSSGYPSASSVSATELGYLSGVSSSIQTQLNAKEPSITTLSLAKGGIGVNGSTGVAQNAFFAGPASGGSGAASFRAMNAADLPAGTLTGSGTSGYLPKYSAASTLAVTSLFSDGTGNVGIGTTSPGTKLDIQGALTLRGASTGAIVLQAPGTGGAATFTFPAGAGTNGQVLTTNGAGVLSWSTPSAGGGTPGGANKQIQFNNSGSFGGSANLVWDNTNGRLGIGTTTPAAALDVVGDIQFTGVLTDVSDRRLKTRIQPLDGGLDRVRRIKTYSYAMKNDPRNRTEFGVMAQDLAEIIPELVQPLDDRGDYYGVNYVGLIPWSILALQESDREIAGLKDENTRLQQRMNDLERKNEELQRELRKILDRLGR